MAGDGMALRGELERLSFELGRLEDANAIRGLHRAYGRCLEQRLYDDVVGLFADDAEVCFNGGVFVGKGRGIRRLYVDHFGQRFAGANDAPVHGLLLEHPAHQDAIEVAPDRRSAAARFHGLTQMSVPLTAQSSVTEMARQQGQGGMQMWAGILLEVSYVRDGETWKIRRLEYRAVEPADYAPGGALAGTGRVAPFATTYPENPSGPDRLVAPMQARFTDAIGRATEATALEGRATVPS
jgi:hypothetical protein